MNDYKPNSNRFKEEQQEREKKIEKVVTGKVVTRKKSGLTKFKDEIISGDVQNVRSYIFGEVLIPAMKKAIQDIVTDGIDIILNGEARGRRKYSAGDRVSYNGCWTGNQPANNRPYNQRPVAYNDIVLESYGEAENVLNLLNEVRNTYGFVRVADLYDMAGVSGSPIDNKFGWTNISSAKIVRVTTDYGYGYCIQMPKAMPIE